MDNNLDYMLLGYGLMALVLVGMAVWLYARYRILRNEMQLIDQIEAEELAEQAAPRETVPEQSAPMFAGGNPAPKET